ncbi:hypothetical protein Hanom_Chr07g00654301 [Helianthus anomalus]
MSTFSQGLCLMLVVAYGGFGAMPYCKTFKGDSIILAIDTTFRPARRLNGCNQAGKGVHHQEFQLQNTLLKVGLQFVVTVVVRGLIYNFENSMVIIGYHQQCR